MVVVVGIDVHKGTHCAVAVDEAGRQLERPVTMRATDAVPRQLLRWARRTFDERVEFAVEDCRHVSGRLERAPLDAAATVVRVPPKLMALTRTSARTRGKSDPIDALAIARAALREPDLPLAQHAHASREVKQLVDHREAQIRLDGLGRACYQRRRAADGSSMEALRVLKRRLARTVFNLLRPPDRLAAALMPQAA